MSTNNSFRSDLPRIHNIIQNSMIVYPKEVIISVLRNYFSKDSYYHCVNDQWGFQKTADQTDTAFDAGISDDTTTRLFIGENYRFDGIFYPAILVKNNGSKYVPVSINREESSVQYGTRIIEDGYGNSKIISYPKNLIFAGAWEGSIAIDIYTRSLRSRDELLEYTAICLTDIHFKDMLKAGVMCKPLTIGSPSEVDDRNDKLFKQTITFDVRSEWRREIPIYNVVEIINYTVEFANNDSNNAIIDHNLTIHGYQTIVDAMLGS
jgi:hypothetical protein